ncbi:MAG: MBL fold metallo-hydrolase [Bdellovibrio sp.]|nr:MBL fold metallo-hydrolase [Bdellovibrio sp.]
MVRISRILHAGYLFESGETRIIFDPLFENPFSRNCYAFPEVRFDLKEIQRQRFDAVFISHYHDDHCSIESLNLIDRNTPIYMFCIFEEMFDLLRQLGFSQVNSLQLNTSVRIGTFEIIPRRALDEDVDSLFQVKADGLNILNVVDSWIDYETLDLLKSEDPWDLIMWPFQTMRELEVLAPSVAEPAVRTLPPEWLEQLAELNPRYVIPSSCQFKFESWSWYNEAFFPITYAQFDKEIREAVPGIEVVRLNPSCAISFDGQKQKRSTPLSWVQPQGEQNTDYIYNENIVPQSTGEISRHFTSVSPEHRQRIRHFCESEIVTIFNSLEGPQDSFFDGNRIWQLSIYDHLGEVHKSQYRISAMKMTLLETMEEPTWTTEIPEAKLFAALELGESLTSIYARVIAPATANIMEDPLIRSLYDGKFASYQRAQLQILRGNNGHN